MTPEINQKKIDAKYYAQQIMQLSEKLEKVYQLNPDEIVKANKHLVAAACLLEGVSR